MINDEVCIPFYSSEHMEYDKNATVNFCLDNECNINPNKSSKLSQMLHAKTEKNVAIHTHKHQQSRVSFYFIILYFRMLDFRTDCLDIFQDS